MTERVAVAEYITVTENSFGFLWLWLELALAGAEADVTTICTVIFPLRN